MNSFKAKVTKIENLENLNIVQFKFGNSTLLSMMSLELDNLKEGMKVILNVKASHIGIAKDFSGLISFSNFIPSTIIKINKGKLLSDITLKSGDTIFTSIITSHSVNRMGLKENEEVSAVFKASELAIKEVLEDD